MDPRNPESTPAAAFPGPPPTAPDNPTDSDDSTTHQATSYTVGVAAELNDMAAYVELEPELRLALRRIARTQQLLVGCDYDGTLAPIVADPTQARPLPAALAAVRSLAELPDTNVAVISGRALRDLAAMSRLPVEVQLVGSHGAEFDLGSIAGLADEMIEQLGRITSLCVDITEGRPGAMLEPKPSGVAVHVRNASREDAAHVLSALHEQFDKDPAIHLTAGKEVLEISVINANKGDAIVRLRDETHATATVFIGDDVTDEDAFSQLRPGADLSIRVGPGPSSAQFRIADPTTVLAVLTVLREERHAWIAGAHAVAIEDHSLLSDGANIALLTPDASINWLCHPRPDAPAIFAGLLGDPEAGHLSLRPVRGGRILSQNYLDQTMTVVTKWSGVTLTDYLDCSYRQVQDHEHQLRLIRVVQNRTPVEVTFAPRPQFGSVPVSLQATDDGIRVTGSADPMVLIAPGLDWEISYVGAHPTARAVIPAAESERASDGYVVELRAGTDDMGLASIPEAERRRFTHEKWRTFCSQIEVPSAHSRSVIRSALTLRGLCHEPTGGVLAAATTSLPEWIGGIRNWDYRYCWLRDGAMTVGALSLLGSTQEADSFLAWLEAVFASAASPDHVHPLYALDGTILGPEAVVDTLPGYAGSRPVRIGNAAQGQVQLDVFGPICAMVADTAAQRGFVTARDLTIVNACVDAVSRRWNEPDHGIWEIRDSPRDHVHSRVMCWQAVDQGLAVVRMNGSDRPDWQVLRDEIAADILTNGWDEDLNSFVSAYGRTDVDAACLAVITSGLIPGDDPRALGTIRAVEASLRDGPTVYRYRHDDGLPGTEGGMHICTTWLIEAYVAVGLLDEAENLYQQLLDCAGVTGLLPEMHHASTDRGLGNHPQAYSHLGLIRCALALERAQQGVR